MTNTYLLVKTSQYCWYIGFMSLNNIKVIFHILSIKKCCSIFHNDFNFSSITNRDNYWLMFGDVSISHTKPTFYFLCHCCLTFFPAKIILHNSLTAEMQKNTITITAVNKAAMTSTELYTNQDMLLDCVFR